ncbi:MAG: general secretion pathway protein GspB [Rudaea sp.]
MSLILEALKKSEARRRLGNAPDLGTPFATTQPRRRVLPYIVIAIAVVVGFGVWILHKSATPIAPAANTETAPAQRAPARLRATAIAQHSIAGPVQRPQAVQTARQLHALHEPARMLHAQAQGSTKRPRGERPNYQMPARHPPANPAHAAAPDTATAKVAQPAATVSTAKATSARAALKPELRRGDSTHPDPTRMVVGPSSVPTKPALPAEPASAPTDVPPYYQLAYDVRKALPPLKLSMHVYAADPAARFVILNDSRMTEGEKTTDDVTLEKIVPDGVILEFKGHRFFYPRDAL